MNQLKRLYSLILETPNDKMLGKKIREMYLSDASKWDKSQVNITKEQALNRLEYLKSELGYEGYHDGWTLKGMKEEFKWLESQLDKLKEEKQLNLFG